MELLQLKNPDLVATALQWQDADLACRLYSLARTETPVEFHTNGLSVKKIALISGETTQALAPFKIGTVLLGKGPFSSEHP
jgi:hypothetical protein